MVLKRFNRTAVARFEGTIFCSLPLTQRISAEQTERWSICSKRPNCSCCCCNCWSAPSTEPIPSSKRPNCTCCCCNCCWICSICPCCRWKCCSICCCGANSRRRSWIIIIVYRQPGTFYGSTKARNNSTCWQNCGLWPLAGLHLPRRHATLLGVIKQDVKVTGSIAKHSEDECYLSTVMHGMVGAVVQQLSYRHRIPASLIEVFNVSQKIRITKRSQELTNISVNPVPVRDDGFQRGVVLACQCRPALCATAAIQPSPLRAQRMD